MIPVVERCMKRVYGRSLAGIAGSNPTVGIDDCLLWVLCVVRKRYLRQAYHSSKGVPLSVVCLSVITKPRQLGDLCPMEHQNMKKKCYYYEYEAVEIRIFLDL